MKEEIEVYVVHGKDGLIWGSDYSFDSFIERIPINPYDDKVRLITVYKGDVLYNRHWQDVDLFHRRLKACNIWTSADMEKIEYCHKHLQWEHGIEEPIQSFPDLHTALAQLVTLEGE